MNKKIKKGKRKMWTAIFVIIGFIVLIVGAVRVGIGITTHQFPANPEIMGIESENSLKALVVYQPSITSASYDAAHAIAEGLHEKGYEVTLNTPGEHLSNDISVYAVVVFGSPNYGGSPAKALLDYMSRIDDYSGKRVLLFSTSGSAEGRLEFDKMEVFVQNAESILFLKLRAGDTEKNYTSAYQFGQNATNNDYE